ncbi:2-oxoglutarate dehydrogenase, E2 component, dihydrolipoamide succinyltransferase [Tessaracoccus antarcticus]|uniref:Dihydrolipoamide acetyltransferase component of pyruvate dehydrogenase complex n=1 Tax=Tessaracoccus antarcticus TaxID=2479848 RepID=A0A3M0G3T5_9ACTN|nr:2-oxoglutarate dehydrogenase, E2 component, dihydrolipoamide succinyltransferase [Tessaracoccus antarcticus]RMB59631.1 2-oxoglutarate dehydrogenase, E2 component, dihydrolipoamide succinyltransferase [Tessaracoccus antarcticus]
MSTEVTLPALGESVTEGTVSRWLKAVGETVEVDEPLLEVSTDKVDTEIPSPVAGTLLEIRFEEDDIAEVGAVLAIVGDAADAGGSDSSDDSPSAEDSSQQDEAQAQEVPEDATQEAADGALAKAADDVEGDSSTPASGGSGTEVTLPALGESVTEGTISRWLKEVGEAVEVDEPLLEVSTDKVDTEIPSPVAGTLLEIRFKEDDVAEVGAVLAVVGAADAGARVEPAAEPEQKQATPKAAPTQAGTDPEDVKPSKTPPAEVADEAPQEKAPSKPAAKPSQEQSPAVRAAVARRAAEADGDATYVTPLVRKLAREHDVDLTSVKGTGVGGRIRKQDVLAAGEAAKEAAKQAAAKPAASAAADRPSAQPAPAAKPEVRGTTEKLSRLRKTIANRMVHSLQVSAQLTATVEVDVTAISRIRAVAKDDFKKREGASLSYLPFITMAAIEALKAFPVINARIDTDAGTVTYADGEHIGIAVDTEKGLLVPVIKDAGDLNLTGLAKKIGDLAARTRASKVGPDELSGSTFTITNYGSAGTLFDTPIVNQPEVAILGTGALVKRPVVVKDQFGQDVIAVRDMMYLSMSYDHRLVDGALAARFLSHVKARLEEGDFGGELGL